jgi:hypothetical protein
VKQRPPLLGSQWQVVMLSQSGQSHFVGKISCVRRSAAHLDLIERGPEWLELNASPSWRLRILIAEFGRASSLTRVGHEVGDA